MLKCQYLILSRLAKSLLEAQIYSREFLDTINSHIFSSRISHKNKDNFSKGRLYRVLPEETTYCLAKFIVAKYPGSNRILVFIFNCSQTDILLINNTCRQTFKLL